LDKSKKGIAKAMTKKEMNALIDAVEISNVKVFKHEKDGIFPGEKIDVMRYSIVLNGRHRMLKEMNMTDALTKKQWIKFARKNYIMELMSNKLPDVTSFEENLKKNILKMVEVSDEKISKIKNEDGVYLTYSGILDGWYEQPITYRNTKKTKKDFRVDARSEYIKLSINGCISPKAKRSTSISAQ
jgi:DNA-directed RNA polymerase subunit H (RpoH/RPB5)